ncbi:MAG: dicarboxylate/amino acid:cation symporter [Gammaproteobacteria bacterium]|nr:dicarboxylate/amino acid:cation symporter [Gammaproteobacteria bacterium]
MKLKLHWQILIALAFAVAAGLITGQDSALLGVTFDSVYQFIGQLFLQALKMLIVPLVLSSIIVGVSGLGNDSSLGRMGLKTLLYYALTSFIAINIGLMVVNFIGPGYIDGEPAKDLIGLQPVPESTIAKVEGRGAGDIADIFLRIVPSNIVAAAHNGQMLGLIFFSLLFGFFMTRISQGPAQTMKSFWEGVFETMMGITDFIMKFAPIGVFGLVAHVIAGLDSQNVAELFSSLALFMLSVLLALAIHAFIVMPIILSTLAKVNPLRHIKAMLPAMLTAFSTASSSATLPITMECVEKNAGVSNKTSSFVLPLGATINMDGTALYECVAAVFIAQAYGLELTFMTQFTIVLIALLTSIGVAGIPSASLVAITIVLSAIGLPLEAIGLILAVDRILDMFRTSVNVFSDSCGAVVIAKSEGETGILEK